MKKGQLNQLSGFALTIVIFAVVLAVGFSILSRLNTSLTASTYEANATTAILKAMADIPNWIPIIIIAAVGGIVLFIITRQFRG